MRSEVLKRVFDIAFAFAAVILLAPIMLATGLLVAATMGLPVLFRQQRPGLLGRPFTILKFRTMRSPANDSTASERETDERRLTRVGSILRSLSLDELPELLNVLAGDMSLVGPRPLLTQYLDRYTAEQARRHEVKPGMTGWAQINGRNALSWDARFRLDVWYVDHRTLGLDLKILALTAWKILTREGIAPPGQATMPEFRGSHHE